MLGTDALDDIYGYIQRFMGMPQVPRDFMELRDFIKTAM
jgi:hypothetical protein